MNLLDVLPSLFTSFEKICIKIATKGWHRPGFYLSTLFTAPLALYLHRKETHYTGITILLKIAANILLILSFLLLLRLWIFLFLLPIARVVKFVYDHLRIGEEAAPIPLKLTFPLGKLDFLALLFIFFIFLGFLLHADTFNPFGSDSWYHMAVARKIEELHTIPLWDTWEFQPIGRPHLYPPLLHILIAGFSRDYEHIIEGARALQILLYPAALFASWYFSRLLFSAKVAFIALVILSMDSTFSLLFIGLMPSCLVNLLFPFILAGFLSRRLFLSVPPMVLCLYSHLSFPFLVLVCLFVLSYKYRTYFSFYKKFVLISLIFYLPWALRVLFFRDFLRSFVSMTGYPLVGLLVGMISLQIFNPIFLYCGIQGLRKSQGVNRDVVKYILIGFLPALVFYGGRYWFHTAPFWSIFIALYLEKKITSKKGMALLLVFALLPLPLFAFNVPKGVTGQKPGPLMLSTTSLDVALGLVHWPSTYYEEDQLLKGFIEKYTSPQQIIHVDEAPLADKIVVLTGRPVDNGMWFEVGSKDIQKVMNYNRLHDRPALFVYLNKGRLPPVDEVHQIGRYWVGWRAVT